MAAGLDGGKDIHSHTTKVAIKCPTGQLAGSTVLRHFNSYLFMATLMTLWKRKFYNDRGYI